MIHHTLNKVSKWISDKMLSITIPMIPESPKSTQEPDLHAHKHACMDLFTYRDTLITWSFSKQLKLYLKLPKMSLNG